MNDAADQHQHVPVMLDEVMHGLRVRTDGCYFDATYGRGGHARAIVGRLGPTGRLLIMDRDPHAIKAAHDCFDSDRRVHIIKASFATAATQLMTWIAPHGCLDGALMDVGVSSPQLDDPSRGFSFMRDGPLDMRMDTESGHTAAEWLALVEEDELRDVIRRFGEERHARRVARAICRYREQQPINTTTQLADIVSAAVPRPRGGQGGRHLKHPATRTFQAIRMVINRELDEISTLLPAVVEALCPHGRFAVISFHSLEDRLVKRFFQAESRGDDFPIDFPVTQDRLSPTVVRVGKAIKPSDAEIERNPRARSARLRVVEKLAA